MSLSKGTARRPSLRENHERGPVFRCRDADVTRSGNARAGAALPIRDLSYAGGPIAFRGILCQAQFVGLNTTLLARLVGASGAVPVVAFGRVDPPQAPGPATAACDDRRQMWAGLVSPIVLRSLPRDCPLVAPILAQTVGRRFESRRGCQFRGRDGMGPASASLSRCVAFKPTN